jgi:hypothetical protein
VWPNIFIGKINHVFFEHLLNNLKMKIKGSEQLILIKTNKKDDTGFSIFYINCLSNEIIFDGLKIFKDL